MKFPYIKFSTLQRKDLYPFMIFFLCIFHRLYLFVINKAYLDLHYMNNNTWLTWQFFSFDILRNDLSQSLLYLQQQPPFPMLLLGIISKCFYDSRHIMYSLIAIEAVLTSLTASLIYMILKNYLKSRKLAALFSIIFGLSLDIIVIEYNSLGQTFYEILTMFLVTAIVFQFNRSFYRATIKSHFILGLLTGLLALTRASFSYFFVVIVFFIMLRPVSKSKAVVAFLSAIVLIQGSWVIKNAYIYNYFDVATSSWVGQNLAAGLYKAGYEKSFSEHLAEDNSLPDWFKNYHLKTYLPWWGESVKSFVSESSTSEKNSFENELPYTNSRTCRQVSSLYRKAVIDFYAAYPSIFLKKFLESYAMFWEPTRNFGSMYVAFFKTSPAIYIIREKQLVFFDTVQSMFNEKISYDTDKYILFQSTEPGHDVEHWIGFAILTQLLWMVNIIAFHTGLILFMIIYLKKRDNDLITLLFAFATIAYLGSVTSITEYGENMRFRIAVEPEIWILTGVMGSLLVSKLCKFYRNIFLT